MRSRRLAVDNGSWLYHDFYATNLSLGTSTADHGAGDYITLDVFGGGDDPSYSAASPVGPDYLTIWASGIVTTDSAGSAQIIFMNLATANSNYDAFPGEHISLGFLDAASVDSIELGAHYLIPTKYPVKTVFIQLTSLVDGLSSATLVIDDGTASLTPSGYTRSALNLLIDGLDAVDTIVGSAQAQTIHGHAGNDILLTGAAQTDLFGDEGNDTLIDHFGQANLYGGTGADEIFAGPGDYVSAGDDNDVIHGVTQSNAQLVSVGFSGIRGYFDGGAGTDKVIFDLSGDPRDLLFQLVDNYDPHVGAFVSLNDTLALVSIEAVEIRGGTGNDALSGASENDAIYGGAGADVLDGGAGNDLLDGGAGGLPAGQHDVMFGGAGDDTMVVHDSADEVFEFSGGGTDTVQSFVTFVLPDNVENLTLVGAAVISATGNAAANILTGNDAANTLTGLGGDDVINGGKGADIMIGGTGNDTYYVDNIADKAIELSSEGYDRVYSSVSFSLGGSALNELRLTGNTAINADGNNGDNSLFGNTAANVLTGFNGTDILNGGAGADTMIGGAGDDTYYVDTSTDKVIEAINEGTDTIYSTASFALTGSYVETLRLTGTAAINAVGNDEANTLVGNDGANILTGLGGADVLNGGKGGDIMIGGLGDDTYYVDDAADKVQEKAGEGTDTIYSTVSFALSGTFAEVLRLAGTSAINATGDSLANTLVGNAGANVINGLGGIDLMIGGAGDDMYGVDNTSDRVVEKLGGGNDTIFSSATFSLAGTYVETLRLIGTAAINATGNGQANKLVGNDGANILTGLGGADVLDGGKGGDIMIGGLGDDTYYVDSAADTVIENAGEGNDTVYAAVTYALTGTFAETLRLTGTAVINATGNDEANTLVGNDGVNTLTGLGGADVLDGGKGADTMLGGAGDDTYYVDNIADKATELNGEGTDTVFASVTFGLDSTFIETLNLTGTAAINATGNSQANTLIGNDAANVLSGLGGADTLDGGLGADTLTGGDGADIFRFSIAPDAVNIDRITDFTTAADKIALVGAAFNELAPGALAPTAFYLGTAAHTADDRIIYDAATGKLWFDDDGTGDDAAIVFATLAPNTVIAAADLMVI